MNPRFILLCIGFFLSFTSFSQKDILLLENGDRIIGEVKRMDQGILNIKTDYSSGELKIKWKKVVLIESSESFLVTSIEGKRYVLNGLETNLPNFSLIIGEDRYLDMNDVVLIRPVKDGFLSRMNASISVGYNFAKASNLSQLSVGSTLGYTSEFYSIGATFNSVRSSQDNIEEIQRTYGDLSFNYFLKNDYFFTLQSEYLSNSEQKLRLRMTNKLGFGKYFIHTNKMYFAGEIGVAWNNESYDKTIRDNRNSGEAFAALGIDIFDFNKFNLTSNLTAYPSLTEKDRIRADFKIDLKYKLPLDLFIKLGFNYNYDNKSVEGASYDDYVVRTTLGWEL